MNGWYTNCLLIAAGSAAGGAGVATTGTIIASKSTFGIGTFDTALSTNAGATAIGGYVLLAAGIGLVLAGVLFAVLTGLVKLGTKMVKKTSEGGAKNPQK